MKIERHAKIIELINEYAIETQEELAARLNDAGFRVTQATVSRDIRELKLTKMAVNGRQRYVVVPGGNGHMGDKYIGILRDSFLSMEMAQNILVIRTASGMAGAVAAVSRHAPEVQEPEGEPLCHVVLWDFGAKRNIRRELVKRGCRVTTVDAAATAADILALKPDGLMLSNGPGDPAENVRIVEELRKLTDTGLPAFGICLGHQLLALALGGRTEKRKYGHRGANQPAVRTADGRVFITSQNHGYAVVGDSLPGTAAVSYVNGNDGSCEGVTYTHRPAFSVQFHPEAAGGPQDTSFLFDDFIRLMKGEDAQCR